MLSFPVAIYESVEQDSVQPCPHVRARSESVKPGTRPGNSLLHEIFGILPVPSQLESDAQ
jgi:hypothetical protein